MSLEFINTKKLAARIAEVKEELAQLLHLESFVSKKTKRGRPTKAAGGKKAGATAVKKTNKGKRGKLGLAILKFLESKGKNGAHIKDIAAAAHTKPANITAWVYTTGKAKVKKVKPATFAKV